ncbi:MAG: hypothetical protein IPN79_15845 [Saprospiraceae bacterium]|nr:hypothetical protein [Saprospiraceae bacterium]
MYKLLIVFLLSALYVVTNVQAAHIIGGEVSYACISSNSVTKQTTFTVKYTLYRDVLGGGALFDQTALFGLYAKDKNTNQWVHVQTYSALVTNLSLVSLNDPCVTVPSNVRVEKGNYIFNVTIPWDDQTYMISYQRCCRNNSISNLLNPQSTGAVYNIELSPESVKNCNNSPVFNFFPPTVICNNRPLQFDHSTSDIEGDSVVYAFCIPLTSGGQEPGDECNSIVPSPFKCPPPYANVVYSGNYAFDTPMAANPLIQVNPENGFMTGTPNLTGQYVLGVCIKEYRNGVLLTETRRDFQFNVVNCTGVTFNQNITICENDSVTVNNVTYTEAGTFTQNFINSVGCDSILVLQIKQNVASEEFREVTICAPEVFLFEGETLTASGTYTKMLTNSVGCDSTITLRLTVLTPGMDTLQYFICDDEKLEINNIVYDAAGEYTQVLTGTNGCDSTLIILVKKGITTLTTRNVYLCLENDVVINGIPYQVPGTFEQNYQTESGCDSTLVIKVFPCDENLFYDFQLCNAMTPEQSMIYGEFIPAYTKQLSCGRVTASNIYRDMPQEFKHSCSAGQESTLSMCVSASKSCDPALANQKPVLLTFVVDAAAGNLVKWNHFVYHHNSPSSYAWISGPSGVNNGPTKFLMKIYKNGLLLMEETKTTTNGWTKQQLDFYEDPDFLFAGGDSITIEWWPYCAIGNNAEISVWDLDNISMYFSCESVENRTFSGNISGLNDQNHQIVVKRYLDEKVVTATLDQNTFTFLKNDPYSYYTLKGYLNTGVAEGVSGIDIVLVQQHILGLRPFTNPVQYIAADVNRDGRINSLDLLDMRKVILGLREFFPNNTSWRFIPMSECKKQSNPLTWEDVILVEPGYQNVNNLDFLPVKTGDLDGVPVVPEIGGPSGIK